MIPLCNFDSMPSDKCVASFHHYPTSRGMCSGLNSMPIRELWDSSYHPYFDHLAAAVSLNQDSSVKNIPKDNSKLRVLLDSHNL